MLDLHGQRNRFIPAVQNGVDQRLLQHPRIKLPAVLRIRKHHRLGGGNHHVRVHRRDVQLRSDALDIRVQLFLAVGVFGIQLLRRIAQGKHRVAAGAAAAGMTEIPRLLKHRVGVDLRADLLGRERPCAAFVGQRILAVGQVSGIFPEHRFALLARVHGHIHVVDIYALAVIAVARPASAAHEHKNHYNGNNQRDGKKRIAEQLRHAGGRAPAHGLRRSARRTLWLAVWSLRALPSHL